MYILHLLYDKVGLLEQYGLSFKPSPFQIIHKDQFQMDYRSELKKQNSKVSLR